MNRSFTLAFFLFSFYFIACNGQSHSKAIAIISELNEKGEVLGKSDTGWVEYLDKGGNIIKKVSANSSENGGVIKTTLYNSAGRYTSKIVDYRNGLVSRTDAIRDSNGYIIAMKSYDLNSHDTSWAYYLNKFDRDSKYLLSSMIDSKDSSVIAKFKTKFDKNRNIIEDIELDSLNNEISKNIYEYTDFGKLLKQTYYANGVQISSTQYKYEGQKKIESILTPASKESNKIKTRFIYQ